MDLKAVLETLRELKPLLMEKYNVLELAVFGSYVKGLQSPQSDIDILVLFSEKADLFDFTGLANLLEEELDKKVDIVSKHALKSEIQDSVFKESITV